MSKYIACALAILLLVFVACMLIGAGQNAEEVCWKPYIVCPGDNLYDIAAEVGVENPEKFSYEVCKKNGIPQGGLIHPGEIILIYGEVVE